MANNTKNLANAIVATDVGTSATTLVLEAGYGASMPAVPFFLTCTPPGQLSTMGNSEIVLVTARTSDTLTIQRAKKQSTARDIKAGWVVSNSVYVETSTQIGDIITTLNATPRAGRLFMNGGTHNKDDWPLMWQHIVDNPAYGTTTSTTFTLADMRERMPFGKSDNGPYATLGAIGGSATHTHGPGTFQANVQIERAGNFAYLDFLETSTNVYRATTRLGMTVNSVTRETNNEYQDSGVGIGGTSGSSSSMPPYKIVNYEVIAE